MERTSFQLLRTTGFSDSPGGRDPARNLARGARLTDSFDAGAEQQFICEQRIRVH